MLIHLLKIKNKHYMNKKITWGIVVVLLVALGWYFKMGKGSQVPSTPTAVEQKTIKLGLMFPLTGQFAGIGEGIKNASLMAIEDYKASHPNTTITTTTEDDALMLKREFLHTPSSQLLIKLMVSLWSLRLSLMLCMKR